jgi:hypothetical protein
VRICSVCRIAIHGIYHSESKLDKLSRFIPVFDWNLRAIEKSKYHPSWATREAGMRIDAYEKAVTTI